MKSDERMEAKMLSDASSPPLPLPYPFVGVLSGSSNGPVPRRPSEPTHSPQLDLRSHVCNAVVSSGLFEWRGADAFSTLLSAVKTLGSGGDDDESARRIYVCRHGSKIDDKSDCVVTTGTTLVDVTESDGDLSQSHLLAALAYYLLRYGRRVVYLPRYISGVDPVSIRYLQTALFLTYGDSAEMQQTVAECDNYQKLVHFCANVEDRLYFVVDVGCPFEAQVTTCSRASSPSSSETVESPDLVADCVSSHLLVRGCADVATNHPQGTHGRCSLNGEVL